MDRRPWCRHPGSPGDGQPELAVHVDRGLLGLLTGRSVWTSPDFTVNPGATGPSLLSFQRATEIQALIDLGGQAATSVNLVDKTNPAAITRTSLFTAPITANDPTFKAQGVSVPQDRLQLGHKYALEFVTTFTATTLQAVNGITSVFYDDVNLKTTDGTDTGTVPPVVETVNATELTATDARLNGLANPKGLETTTGFQYGATTAYGSSVSFGSVGAGTQNVPFSAKVGGLTKCTTYHYRATGTNSIGTGNGQDLTFTTDCQPTANTLVASPVGAQGAVFNASVTPNGPETTYYYEYGTTTGYGARTTGRSAGSGREAHQPLSEPVTGLKPETTYHVRVVAGNALGTTQGDDVTFTTPPLTGAAGSNGTNGANGTNGTSGTGNGTSGSGNGTTGQSNTVTTLRSGDARALLTIRSSKARVGLTGKRAGQIRLPIFCKKETGRSCAGTVKLRTRVKINPSSKPGKKKTPRLVTLATFEYQLQAGRKGYAISTIQPEKLDLMRLRKSVKITISVQVTDSRNNRQTIVRPGTMVAQRTV